MVCLWFILEEHTFYFLPFAFSAAHLSPPDLWGSFLSLLLLYQLVSRLVSAFACFISLPKLCPSIPTTRCPDAILQEEAPAAPRKISQDLFWEGHRIQAHCLAPEKTNFGAPKHFPAAGSFKALGSKVRGSAILQHRRVSFPVQRWERPWVENPLQLAGHRAGGAVTCCDQ